MAGESIHDTLERVRRPRVHITYQVETDGAIELKELPFVVGVLADLSGQPDEPLPRLQDRPFLPIDRDNFDTVLKGMKPRLVLSVDNKLDETKRDKINVELRFNSLDDFGPERIAEQVAPLSKLLEARGRLDALKRHMGSNDTLIKELEKLLKDPELLQQVRKEAGLEPGGDAGDTPTQG
jgi:type VI secretion system protein ImpB